VQLREHSLDTLLSDPTLTATLSRQSALDLLTKTAALSAVLTARVLATAPERPNARHQIELPDAGDLITVAEAAATLRRSRRWIWRHKRKLPFVREISARSLLCSKRGIAAWLSARAASG
jgi:hypothetical protein